jgi:hypothetical protein
VGIMTGEQQKGQVATTEAPATRDVEAHTSEDHRASHPETSYRKGADVTAPFREATSLRAPPLEQKR